MVNPTTSFMNQIEDPQNRGGMERFQNAIGYNPESSFMSNMGGMMMRKRDPNQGMTGGNQPLQRGGGLVNAAAGIAKPFAL